MSGRYAFSLPDPRSRDGWFRIGTLDVTTTALIVGLGIVSMVLYAVDPAIPFKGALLSDLVADGEVWRLVTWPLVNPPALLVAVGLFVFWWLGHLIEEEIGRGPYTIMLAAMTVLPAALVTLIGIDNDPAPTAGRWAAYAFGTGLLSTALFVVFVIDKPGARFFFGIPAWALAAVLVGIDVLSYLADRAWAELLLLALVIAVACFAARQRGMVERLSFLPRLAVFSGGARVPSASSRRTRPPARGRKVRGGRRGAGEVVEGPWGGPPAGLSPLEQAELDVLLDKVSATGVASLTAEEQSRLQGLSRRLRER